MERTVLSAREIEQIEANMARQPIVGLAMDVPAGAVVEPHRHMRGQLMFANEGVMVIESGGASWVVPPQRALWVPRHVEHKFTPVTGISLRNILVQPGINLPLPDCCCLVRVTPLLRELILRVVESPSLCKSDGHRQRIADLIFDEMEVCPATPVMLPMPKDVRLQRICIALKENPSDPRTLDDWADIACASSRTLTRRFIKETGLSFAHWRRQLRLMSAMVLLGSRQSVTTAALEVGYNSPSAFIEAFRRSVGQTPGQYFAEGELPE
ncbi:helix-turn-helix transcriptional regulator [Vineibacter terrae]|uniref:AraC family transcriptional regulator n=1 Tax=Vineibacter terrae TaxID=2586908 RepID=UPI002E3087FF|nr:helix-turn-helix transcriptional regulator [Vineibacter terrae]HEX2891525.1 helix-turn-helix transcriptional regulator [Vineibacter terrae]